jgi:iron complex outermembrane receptor protein
MVLFAECRFDQTMPDFRVEVCPTIAFAFSRFISRRQGPVQVNCEAQGIIQTPRIAKPGAPWLRRRKNGSVPMRTHFGPLKRRTRKHVESARADRRTAKALLCSLALCATMAQPAADAAALESRDPTAADLVDLSLEQLANVVVTSVSRREERLADAPASIFVISQSEIRRSGATSIPEALRLAPNLNIARADTNQYAISARGFNNTLANKMLVLVDGRTIYTPLFSGVFWEAQDVMLEDVDRIEVISGPGATLWGANAVNGVINIITRSAEATQGRLAGVSLGNRENGGMARYGGKLGDDGHYRVYGKYFDRDNSRQANGTAVRDSSQRGQLGFRADWSWGDQGFTLQGDAYTGNIDQAPSAREISGYNLLGRWHRDLANGSSLRIQSYYDRTDRFHPGIFRESLDTFDLEFQHGLKPAGSHKIMWGGGYRLSRDHIENSPGTSFMPPDRDMKWANLFVQDDIALSKDIDLTIGAKAERNPYTGTEFLPSARLAWRPARDRLVWGALSRAVRAPSRIDRDFYTPANPPFLLAGGPNFRAEVANVIELGYRAQPSVSYSFSVTLFHQIYDKLRSLGPSPAGPVFDNNIEGRNTGIETWGSYQAGKNWRLSAGLVAMRERLQVKAGAVDLGGLAALGNDPSHWWMIRSSWEMTDRHDLDVTIRHTGALYNPQVPGYEAVDVRLGWKLNRGLEAALTVQNLFDPRHPEWGVAGPRALHDRSIQLTLVWRD